MGLAEIHSAYENYCSGLTETLSTFLDIPAMQLIWKKLTNPQIISELVCCYV